MSGQGRFDEYSKASGPFSGMLCFEDDWNLLGSIVGLGWLISD
jgi:hypothetical protein